MSRTALAVVSFLLLFVGLLVYSSLGLRRHRVEACMSFEGRTACRTVSAATRDQALRTATENACALISSGMTDSMACDSTPPVRVTWLDDK